MCETLKYKFYLFFYILHFAQGECVFLCYASNF
jgi:hypothetical protein